ncbi:L,D-transpeptidase [Patescibacteria group bacterium]
MNKSNQSVKLYSFGFVLLFFFLGTIGEAVVPVLDQLGIVQVNTEIIQKSEVRSQNRIQNKYIIRETKKDLNQFFNGYFAKKSEDNARIVTAVTTDDQPSDYLGTSGLVPPTGGLEGKFIEINLSTQTFTCWQNGKVWGHFMTSTGRPDMATKPGMFSILDHSPMAWSESAGCWMPWWMGIYFAGSTENGIHELPLYGGVQEPLSHLGQRISHGCVRLAPGVAKRVYDWAVNGTPVYIHH